MVYFFKDNCDSDDDYIECEEFCDNDLHEDHIDCEELYGSDLDEKYIPNPKSTDTNEYNSNSFMYSIKRKLKAKKYVEGLKNKTSIILFTQIPKLSKLMPFCLPFYFK